MKDNPSMFIVSTFTQQINSKLEKVIFRYDLYHHQTKKKICIHALYTHEKRQSFSHESLSNSNCY